MHPKQIENQHSTAQNINTLPAHVTRDQAAVVALESAVHVAVPDPLKPSSQATAAAWPVLPEMDPPA